MTTGEKIAAQRRKAGLSQEALAERLGISRQAVSRWETNESLPDTERIIQLSRIFGVPTDYLLLEEQAESTEIPAESASPASSAPTAPETAAARLFHQFGAGIAGGGAILSLTALVSTLFHVLTIDSWFTDFGRLGTVLRMEWVGAGLMVGILLMLVGVLLLAADYFLRKRP